jgi:hypothetical protein
VSDGPITVFEVREKQWRAVGSSVLLTAVFVFTATVIANDRGGVARVVGVLGAVLCGAVVVLHLRRMAKSGRPYIIISDDGFTDNGPMGVGFVPWLDVTDLQWRQLRKANWVTGHGSRAGPSRPRSSSCAAGQGSGSNRATW